MSGAAPKVVCVVLNWNAAAHTIACLAALQSQTYSNFSTLVVDNGSADDSIAEIRAAHPHIEIIPARSNLGFGAGNNIAVRRALAANGEPNAEYVWLLNNDAAPSPTALAALVTKAESDPRLGAVGSVLHYMHAPTQIQAWGGARMNTRTGYARHSRTPRPDDWFDYLTAASLLIRSAALREIGLFDESFFLYWEDADLGFRLRRAGWKLAVAPNAIVLHAEGAATRNMPALLYRYSTASGIRFLRKHARTPSLAVPLFVTIRVLNRILRLQFTQLGGVIAGVRDARIHHAGPTA
jgi:GT2 family glycosyltransferase